MRHDPLPDACTGCCVTFLGDGAPRRHSTEPGPDGEWRGWCWPCTEDHVAGHPDHGERPPWCPSQCPR